MTEVAAADVVKLMLQFCQENSLQRTMQTLQVCARPPPTHPPHPTTHLKPGPNLRRRSPARR